MYSVRVFKKLFNIVHMNIWLFITSIIVVIIASFLVVIGMGLVVNILNGLAMGGDFLSNLKTPFLEKFIEILHIQSSLGIFTFLIVSVIGLIYLSNIFLLINIFCSTKYLTDIEHELRARIFKKYLEFEKSFYDKAQLGALISNMLNVPRDLRQNLTSMREALVSIIMAAAYLLIIFIISWKLTLLALPILFLLYYSTNWLMTRIRGSAKKHIEAMIVLTSYSADILQNMLLVKSYASEKIEHGRFIEKSDKTRFHAFNVLKKDGSIPILSDVVGFTGLIVLVFIWVVLYIKTGNFSLGKFLVYFFVLRHFITNVKAVNNFRGNIAYATPLVEKIIWVFDDSDKEHLKNGDIGFLNLKEKIQFKNLHFRYIKERQILKDISFTIQKGQTIAIVGPTGSGKTTIAHLLCRFYDPESGFIEIDGIDIRSFTLRSLRKKIAIVTQETMLFNDTIKKNIIYGIERDITQEELDEAAKKAYLYDFINNLPEKYETCIGDRGVKLSGGEKQRLAISRAIIKDAVILILDEATSALDSETELLIQEALRNLTQDKTVLAIAHRLSTIKNADWIVVLEDGAITEQGTIDELLETKGRFYYYWNLQKFF